MRQARGHGLPPCLRRQLKNAHVGEDVDDVHAVPSQLDVADEVEMVGVHQAQAAPPPVLMGQDWRVWALYFERSLECSHCGLVLPYLQATRGHAEAARCNMASIGMISW